MKTAAESSDLLRTLQTKERGGSKKIAQLHLEGSGSKRRDQTAGVTVHLLRITDS